MSIIHIKQDTYLVLGSQLINIISLCKGGTKKELARLGFSHHLMANVYPKEVYCIPEKIVLVLFTNQKEHLKIEVFKQYLKENKIREISKIVIE